MKLSRKLLLRIIALLILCGGIIGGFGVVMTYKSTQELMNNQLDTEVNLRTALINEKIASIKGMNDVYAENPLVIEALKLNRFNDQLKKGFTETVQSRSELMSLMSIVNADGIVLVSDGLNNVEGIDLSAREYLIRSIETKSTQVSKVIVSGADGSHSVAVTSPIYDNGKYIGSVVSTIAFETISDLISGVNIGEGYAYMIHTEGTDSGLTVAHPNKDFVMEVNLRDLNNEGLTQLIDDMKSESSGDGYYTYDGVEKYVKYKSVEHWDVVITINQSDINASANKVRNITILVLLGSIIVSSVAGFLIIRRSIIKPLLKLQDSMSHAGDGDLTHHVQIKTNDEIELLANDYNKMLKNQKEILKKVSIVSEDLAASAEELTASAEDVNISSEEVSLRVTTMMENVMTEQQEMDLVESNIITLGEGVNNTFNLSSSSTEACGEASVVAKAGREGVQNSIESIGEISSSTQSVIGAFELLTEKAKEVTGISATISSIAEQINLLALNASIEAARAGDAGRGFSVVAEEVRKLAEQTTLESENIFSILNHITKLIVEADGYVKNTKNKVDEGEASIISLDGRFVTIMDSVTTLTAALENLKDTSQIQLNGANEIEGSVGTVSKLTHSNTGMAQEIAASCEEQVAITENLSQASEEASSMAEHLKDLISNFKL